MLDLYIVCLNTADDARPDDFWMEPYWAEDGDHAEEQAENANPDCAVVCIGTIPREWVLPPAGVGA